MNNLLRTLCFLFVCHTTLLAQETNKVPLDPSIRTGVLDNGMTYYIKHNEKPKQRASFYFAQNVGSILEKDTQRGLAHFLEHMAFNGTKHFPKKAMLEYLEKNGISFGSEINAFTSFDKTVYNISSVPTTRPQLLDSVLLVLHDWSGGISLLDEEIDNERGVINEEWRSRNTPGYRASEKIWKQGFLIGSKYAERMPIGTMEVVNNFTYEELRDYYHRWYRPDMQAVIVVGDIDVDKMETKIKSLFSKIPLLENLPKRATFDIPAQKQPLIFVEALDKELGPIGLTYYFKNDPKNLKGEAYLKNSLIGNIVSYIINNRFDALTFDETCPALSINYATRKFVRPLKVTNLSVQPRKGQIKEAFEFGLTQFLRFAKYGATEAELQRAKKSIKTSYIAYLNNKENISNESYANQIYDYFFTQNPQPTLEWQVDYTLKTLPEITNKDIIAYVEDKLNRQERVLAVKGNSKASYPSKAEFEKIITEVRNSKLTPYEEKLANAKLINKPLKGSKVESTFDIPGTTANGYVLENGAKVVLYPTDIEKDKIYFSAFSQGGESLLSLEQLPSLSLTTYVASQSGIGTLNKIQLDKKLAGTNTSLGLNIENTSESLSGNSTQTDIETLLKRIYLSFEAPRFDETAFNLGIDRLHKNLKRRAQSIQSAWRDSLSLAKSNHSERTLLFTEELIDNMRFEDTKSIYKSRFSNANDFTFVFVGDIDEAQLLELAKKYIGSISSSEENETYIDHNMAPADGKTVVSLTEKMKTPQTTVNIIFTGKAKFSPKSNLTYSALGKLLSKRYMKVIREQEGGSYGVGASAGLQQIPNEKFYLGVGFKCNPDKAEKLVQVVYDEIERLTETVNKEDLHEIKQAFIKSKEERQDKNRYWLNTIENHLRLDAEILTVEQYKVLVNEISTKDIEKAAKHILKKAAIIEGILNPEK